MKPSSYLKILLFFANFLVGAQTQQSDVIFFNSEQADDFYVHLPDEFKQYFIQALQAKQTSDIQKIVDLLEQDELVFNAHDAQVVLHYTIQSLTKNELTEQNQQIIQHCTDYLSRIKNRDSSVIVDEASITRSRKHKKLRSLLVDCLTACELKVCRDAILNGTLTVGRDAVFKRNVVIFGNLRVLGSEVIEGDVIISGNRTIDGTFTVNGNSFFNGNQQVTGNVNFTGTSAVGTVFTVDGTNTATAQEINAGTAQIGLQVNGNGTANAAIITTTGAGTALVVSNIGVGDALDVIGTTNINTIGSSQTNIGNSIGSGAVNIEAGAPSQFTVATGSLTIRAAGGVAINETGTGTTVIGSATSAINLPGLAASQAVVTDGLQNLDTIAYTNAATANTFAFRDAAARTQVASPTANLDAANKAYVDMAIQGLSVKDPVLVVADSPIVLAGPQVIDGVAVIAGDRVLAAGQGGAPGIANINNGIWVVQAGAWTRPADYASGSSAAGDFTFVQAGATYAGTGWVANTPPPNDIVDVDPISWVEFSVANQITGANVGAGTGQVFRDKTGNTLNFRTLLAANNIIISTAGDEVTISTNGTPLNTPNALVARDGAGGFAAGAITATTLTASGDIVSTGGNISAPAGTVSGTTVSSTTNVTAGNQFLGFNGNSTTPTYSFTSEPNTGMYRPAANQIGFTIAGTNVATITSTGATFTGGISTTGQFLGSPTAPAGAPAFSFTGDADNGMFHVATNDLGFSTGGVQRADISTTVFTSTLPFRTTNGAVGAPAYSFTADPTTGIYSSALDTLNIATGGINQMTIDSGGHILVNDGTAAAPIYSFISNPNTGMYRSGANQLSFSTGGTQLVSLDATGNTLFSGQYLGPSGLVGAPTYSFTAGTTTGMFRPAANTIAFTTAGVTRETIANSTVSFTVPIREINGTVGAPAYSFTADTTTGLYLNAASDLRIAVGGADAMRLTTTQVLVTDGTMAAPVYSFISNTNLGIYRSGVNEMRVVTAGTDRLTFAANGQLLANDGATATPTYSFTSNAGTGMWFNSGTPALTFAAAGIDRLIIPNSGATAMQFRPLATTASAINVIGSSSSSRSHSGTVTTAGAGVATVTAATTGMSTVNAAVAVALEAGSPPVVVTAAINSPAAGDVTFTTRLTTTGATANRQIFYIIFGTSI